jgi:hypothetical protein
MHKNLRITQVVYNQTKCIYTAFGDLKIKTNKTKLLQIWSKEAHASSLFFGPFPYKTSSTKSEREGKITWRHCRNTNLHSQTFSQLEKAMYPLQMYRTKSPKNCCCASFSFLIKVGCAPKNTLIAHLKGPHLFLFGYWLWLFSMTTFSATIHTFLWATNLGCAKSTWNRNICRFTRSIDKLSLIAKKTQ